MLNAEQEALMVFCHSSYNTLVLETLLYYLICLKRQGCIKRLSLYKGAAVDDGS